MGNYVVKLENRGLEGWCSVRERRERSIFYEGRFWRESEENGVSRAEGL